MDSGLTSLGVLIGWGMETTKGVKPTNSNTSTGTSTSGRAFEQVYRATSIGGLSVDPEQIDVSAIVDGLTRYKPGRGDSGGTFTIGINITQETIEQWQRIINTYYNATTRESGLRCWWQVTHPDLAKSFFVVAAPPKVFPMPETGQNEAWTVEINLVVDELIGLDDKVYFPQIDGDTVADGA